MSLITNALTTKTRITERLVNYNSSFDGLIENLINGVSIFIENQCNKKFVKNTYTNELYNGNDCNYTDKLFLKNFPIITITKIEYRSNDDPEEWTTYETDTYLIEYDIGCIKLKETFIPSGIQNIRVTYDAGYKVDWTNYTDTTKHTLPFDLTDICNKLVIKEFKKRESIGKQNENIGGVSINWSNMIDDEVQTVINFYKKII